ncbi:MAG: MFS transporter [Gammaproteobacteria bacterium]|nr:MFS transporter [Gammaproteobacteria bacterium]MDH5650422.1 MFS transporter [Gammaproteobacteria bacterium]
MTQLTSSTRPAWLADWTVYLKPRVRTMFFFGFSAGLPFMLIFSSLSIWLSKAGIDVDTITYFSWAALAYSFKFVWSPLVDKLPIPVLHDMLGRRRSWLLLTQSLVVTAIVMISLADPANGLRAVVIAVVFLGFSSASQDIVIDALRIESATPELQAAMSAIYVAGYRIGMLVSGAGSLYLASMFGQGEAGYAYTAWQYTYLCMALLMSVGIATTLLVSEPERNKTVDSHIHSNRDYAQFLGMFIVVTAAFVAAFVYLDASPWLRTNLSPYIGEVLAKFLGQLVRIAVAFMIAAVVAVVTTNSGLVNREMVLETYVSPVVDFFRRHSKHAVMILLLIGLYRISDIVLGVITNVFYVSLGFTITQIAGYTKVFGVIMTILGGFVGGAITNRFGVMPILLVGAVLVVLTNLLFMVLAQVGNDTLWLAIVIAADNLSAGIASAAFIAYMSSLTNISFTAIQYAIFSSLMTLIPKTIGGYSGSMVQQLGYSNFFLVAALMGIPSILLVLYLMRKMNPARQTS